MIGGMGAVVALSACSSGSAKNAADSTLSSNQSAAQAVDAAVSNLGSGSSIETALSIPITAAQAQQLKVGRGSSGLSPAEAQALTTGTLFLTEATGHGEAIDSTQAQTDSQNAFDLGVSFGSATPLEIRYVGQNLYARAQLPQLYRDLGQSPAQASRLTTELNQLNAAVPGLSSLAQGDWVEVSHAGLESLGTALHQAEGSSGAGASSGSSLQSDIAKLRTELLAALQTNSTVAGLGTANGRSEYGLTIHVANLLATIAPEIRSTLGTIPVVGSRITDAVSAAARAVAPGQTAVIDLYATDGKLSEADLDVNQFDHRYNFAVPLRVAVTSPGAPSAPSGATVLDVSGLPGVLAGLLAGLGSTSLG
jgi:hypothetical protein